jgi:hypothetical protein
MTNPKAFDTNVVLGTGFDRWWTGSDYIYGDRIACGDFADATGTVKDVDGNYLGDYKDEILLTDFQGDHLYIFDPRSTASNKVLQDHGYHTSEGHAVAAGNLDGAYPGWEFAVSHRDDYLRIRYGDNVIAHPDRFQAYDGSGDQMTVGDLDGDGTAE